MGNSVIMDKYTKLAEALKSRGYKMRVGKDSSCTTSILKVSIFPVRENYSFVQDYVYINCYPIMDEEGFILPNLEFCVCSSMDKETFLSLSDRELNAVVTTRNDLIYFCKLLNELGVNFDDDFTNSDNWWRNSNSFVNRMCAAAFRTGAVVLRDFPLPNEEIKSCVDGGASVE